MAMHQVKSALWLVICVAVVGGLLFWYRKPQPQPVPVMVLTEPSPSPEPTLLADSADGEVILEMSQAKGANTITWTLTAVISQAEAKKIWWQTMPQETKMSIPLNTVSPDNKYLFLKQASPDKNRYPVLKVSGEPMMPESQTVEFTKLFEEKYPEYKITEVTGWGGINLIVFNTDKVEGGVGPSFWYEVPSGAFIRLSNRFE